MARKPKTNHGAAGHNSNGAIDKTKLQELVARIEAAEDEKIAVAEDLRGLYAEAKSAGFYATALRQVIRLRRQDQAERDERQAVIDSYMEALAMLQGTPLGDYALRRDMPGLTPPV
jgi:uncharacterized protein (UPF0335 family)